ncbi:TPA: 50S ribosomal protein L30 [Candidatus Woesearchaeota archaeon]|nr:50S ribosomal protein L30 [Candidatus Woesearchaeota archaeon]
MKAIIRISGLVEVARTVESTLSRMRMRRKYTLVLLPATPVTNLLLKKVRNFVAYGNIDAETLVALLQKRAHLIDKNKKVDLAEVAKQLEKKSLQELGIKPFFRLHPPRGGIDARLHFGVRKGVLGDNKEKINDLIRRML